MGGKLLKIAQAKPFYRVKDCVICEIPDAFDVSSTLLASLLVAPFPGVLLLSKGPVELDGI